MMEIWELCNCKSKEEWDNLSDRAKYDRKNRRGLVNPKKFDYTPSLTKVDLQQYIADILLDEEGNVTEIILVNGMNASFRVEKGYTSVYVGNKKAYQLHRVLYAWFKGNIPRNYVVDHIDEDKSNNKLDNLQLLSRKDNLTKSPNYNPSNNKKKFV